MEGSPLLLRNLLTSLFTYSDKFLINLGEKYKLVQLLRYLLVSSFLFILRILPSIFPSLNPSQNNYSYEFQFRPHNANNRGDSGIARAMSQLLAIMNEIPVSSRKYEIVRSLAETVINDNLHAGNQTLLEVNCSVLSDAFFRTLGQLETRMEHFGGASGIQWPSWDYYGMKWVLNVVWNRLGRMGDEKGSSGEKLLAEGLWLAQKMRACGCGEEAVCRWASASKLAWLSLSADPRIQDSLVKVSAFLLKQAKEIGGEGVEEMKREQQRQTKMKILMLWLPLLCQANNGTDAPVLSINEKAELENVLEELIESLNKEEDQEQVLSLWLHHFTHCLSSDWPNLHACYARWCTSSRRLLILH